MLIDSAWLDVLLRGLVLAILAMTWAVVLIRLNGLRSLSKMTNFDFVMTIALGSLIAGGAQASDWQAFAQVVSAIAGLFLAQYLAARIRQASDRAESVMQNAPLILMRNGEWQADALKSARVARSDLVAKLREANVLDLNQVRAVVLETTGDVSVLHGDQLDETLLENVRSV